ncbi:hypothetical protein [Nostoc sp. CMAA1605]|uniref:hypothetical protein n=1 Tax=Nostoc sp. CMAA1605 TaxID=2055159 RepID=UPI001F39A268|nr:hypothetical protein [Nostoc sp. CMAA1605]
MGHEEWGIGHWVLGDKRDKGERVLMTIPLYPIPHTLCPIPDAPFPIPDSLTLK